MAKKKAMAKKKIVAEKNIVPKKVEKKSVALDHDFMDLLRGANPQEEVAHKTSTVDSSVIGLFETALNSIKDSKHRIAQGKDVTKEILNAIEYLQFGISKLKAANK